MRKRRKIIFGIIGGIVAVAVIGTFAVKFYLSSKEDKAIQLAQEYLAQKYEQEMQFHHARFSWIDPSCYQITFTPAGNPELYFQVIVQQNLTILEGLKEFGHSTCPDNYYLNYFSLYSSRQIGEYVQNIWGESASAYVPDKSSGLYSYSVPSEFYEHMALEEMEAFLDYDVYIRTDQLLNNESKIPEAQRILDMIRYVQTSQFKPTEILFWYNTGIVEKGEEIRKSISFGNGTDPYHMGRFENWSETVSIEEIVKAMDDQWF